MVGTKVQAKINGTVILVTDVEVKVAWPDKRITTHTLTEYENALKSGEWVVTTDREWEAAQAASPTLGLSVGAIEWDPTGHAVYSRGKVRGVNPRVVVDWEVLGEEDFSKDEWEKALKDRELFILKD